MNQYSVSDLSNHLMEVSIQVGTICSMAHISKCGNENIV